MELLQNLAAGAVHLLSPEVWVLIVFGVIIGIVFGATPGLTATTAIACSLP